MTVSIAIDAGTRQNVLLVPGAAVRDATTPSPYVFLLEENHLSKRDIRLGTRAGDAVEVVAGLEYLDGLGGGRSPTGEGGDRHDEFGGVALAKAQRIGQDHSAFSIRVQHFNGLAAVHAHHIAGGVGIASRPVVRGRN